MISIPWPTWTDVWLMSLSDRSNFFDDICVDLSYVRTKDSSSSSPRPSCRSVVTVYSRDSQVVSTFPSWWSWENLSTFGLDTRRVVVSLDLESEMLSRHVYVSFKNGAKIRIHIVSVSPKYTVVLRFQLDEHSSSFLCSELVPVLCSKSRERVAVWFRIILSMWRTLDSDSSSCQSQRLQISELSEYILIL